jgi:hypothetical protein
VVGLDLQNGAVQGIGRWQMASKVMVECLLEAFIEREFDHAVGGRLSEDASQSSCQPPEFFRQRQSARVRLIGYLQSEVGKS